jgi:hypothetical protein
MDERHSGFCGRLLRVDLSSGMPHGQGRYVLSGLRVLENLGSDPVADKILFNLFNLINWTTEQAK